MASEDRTCRSRGRPRDPRLDTRILDVVLELMSLQGFARMTMEAVARRAGVPKPTIYRRWACKADLATAALARLQSLEPAPKADTTRDGLRSILEGFQKSLFRPNGMAMIGTLLAEERRHPELLMLFRERIVVPRRRMIREVLERGMARGEIGSDADLDAAVNLLVGSLYARYLAGGPVPREWPSRVVDVVLDGIAPRTRRDR